MEVIDQYNDPGVFSTLAGFEWSFTPQGDNLHRIVLFRDGAERTGQTRPLSFFDAPDPELLWDYLAAYEANSGGRAISVPHNGNLSNGLMFAPSKFDGSPMDAEYAAKRARWEPVHEMTQIKGDEETHPVLSPDDEFADFERWDVGNITGSVPKAPEMLQYEYARSALKLGLKLERDLGVNPFKLGMYGTTDAHTAIPTSREENYFGKYQHTEPSPNRHNFEVIPAEDPALRILTAQESASGLAAVWARENTREAIFDAITRKEVYATTGTRIRVRVFGGWDFEADDLNASDLTALGYGKGVPMGGDLARRARGRRAPLADPGAARPRRRQPRPDPGHQGMDRRLRRDLRADLRRGRVGRPHDRRRRAVPRTRRVHGRHPDRHLHQRHRRGDAFGLLGRPRLRSDRGRVLLRPRDRDPDATLDHARRRLLRHSAARKRTPDGAGSGLHVTDLVYAGRLRRAMTGLQKILREPLLHFLVLGTGLFLLYGVIGEMADERSDRIVVTEAKIGNLAELFERTWRRPPTPAELDGLIEDHIKEEIFYREALALGLEQDDIVIRRRLRQKMEFISEDVAPPAEPTAAELQAFLAEHADRFRKPSRVSFAQVYLSPERRGANARSDAERLLVGLNTGRSDPAEAGDPFLLERDYRELSAHDVEQLFGGPFAAAVAELPVGRWSGPVEFRLRGASRPGA